MAARGEHCVHVSPVDTHRSDDGSVTIKFTADAIGPKRARVEVRHHYSGNDMHAIEPLGDVALAALLLPAMGWSTRLEVESPVSPLLIGTNPRLQALYAAWSDGLGPVEVVAPPATTAPPARGVGLFFSGGVDCFHTLLTHTKPGGDPTPTHLIFVLGFDMLPALSRSRRATDAVASVRSVADAFGLELIVVETDIRVTALSSVGWALAHGAALASIAHGLRGVLGTCLISASNSYRTIQPWGSHPLLDPLWSSEGVELVHTGCDVNRWTKLQIVGAHPTARRHLRVCTNDSLDSFNCGRCEKCISTILAMRATGDLDRVTTLASRLEPRDLRRLGLREVNLVTEMKLELLTQLTEHFDANGDRALATTIRRHMIGSATGRALRRLERRLLSAGRKLLRGVRVRGHRLPLREEPPELRPLEVLRPNLYRTPRANR
ncbi:MAG: hypothetical protein QOC92_2796 [Acidimicrobiaceae bacterium]